MKFKKIFLLSIFLLAVLTMAAVSAEDVLAADDVSTDDSLELNVNDDVIESDESLTDHSLELNVGEDEIGDEESSQKEYDYYNETQINEYVAGSGSNAYFYVPDYAEGSMSISIDNVVKTSKEGGGTLELDIDGLGLSYGKHTAKFTFTGDDYYGPLERIIPFEYAYFKYEIADVPTINDDLTVLLSDDAHGKTKILIDGKTILNEEIDCEYSYSFIDLELKTHTYEIIYAGDSNHPKKTVKGQFDLTYPFSVETDETEFASGDTVCVRILLPYDAEGYATVTANGKTYTVDLQHGEGELELSDFTLGENIIYAAYKNNKYSERTVNTSVYVVPYFNIPSQMQYKHMENISLSLPSTAKGILTVKINGKTYTQKLNNGKAVIKLQDLTVGEYPCEITYSGDFEEHIFSDVNSITVKPYLGYSSNVYINDKNVMIFEAPQKFSGTLRISGAFSKTVQVKNGKATIPLTDLACGENEFDVYFEADNGDVYDYAGFIYVYKDSPDWTLDVSFTRIVNKFGTLGENPYIYLNGVPEELQENTCFLVYIDGKKYSKMETHMEVGSDIYDLSVGTHNLTVTYDGGVYYKAQNKTVSFDVGYVVIDIPPVIQIPYDYLAGVSLPFNASGKIIVNVDGKQFASKKLNPSNDDEEVYFVDFDLSKLKYGSHDIEVIYKGNYGEIQKRRSNVAMDYEIEIGNYYFIYGDKDDELLNFNIPSELKGDFEILIDGKKCGVIVGGDDIDKEYMVNISNMGIGTHKVELKYFNDANLPDKTFNGTIKISAVITHIYEVQYKGEGYVSLILPKDAAGKLSLYSYDADSSEYILYKTSDVSNGIVKIQLPNNKLGSFDMKATFEGNYKVENRTFFYNVGPAIIYPEKMTVGDKKYLKIEIPSELEGNVQIDYLDDDAGDYKELIFNYATVDIVEGKAKIPLSKLPIGFAELILTFNTDQFIDEQAVSIEVKGYTPKLVGGKDITMYYGDSKTYSLKVWGVYGKVVGAGEIVKVKIGKTTYKVKTNKKGIASLKIPTLPGKYTITATYKGVKVTNKLTVKGVATLKTVKVKKSAKKLVLTATLKKGKTPLKNKKVTFKFNGKTYKAKTNKKGVAKVTIKKSVLKKLKAGKKVTYQATYLKNTVKKSVKVKK